MFKLVVLSALLALASAKPGFLGAPLVGAPLAYAHAPVAYSAPLIKAAAVPVATSYANTYKVSVKSPLIAAAPLAYTAPVAYAAPAAYHAPVVAAPAYHAPLAYSAPLAHTYFH